jgi:hypothetical protein
MRFGPFNTGRKPTLEDMVRSGASGPEIAKALVEHAVRLWTLDSLRKGVQ